MGIADNSHEVSSLILSEKNTITKKNSNVSTTCTILHGIIIFNNSSTLSEALIIITDEFCSHPRCIYIDFCTCLVGKTMCINVTSASLQIQGCVVQIFLHLTCKLVTVDCVIHAQMDRKAV